MFCPKCGKQNLDEAQFCGYCGAPFVAPGVAAAQNTTAAPQQGAAPAGGQSTQAMPGLATGQQPFAAGGQAAQASSLTAAGPAGAAVSRRNLLIGAGLGVVVLGAGAFGVSRLLGGRGGYIPKMKDGSFTPVSKAVSNGRVVWLKLDGSGLSADAKVTQACVFENGKATHYYAEYYADEESDEYERMTLGEVSQLSDSELIDELKKRKESQFEYGKQKAIAALKEFSANVETYKAEFVKYKARYEENFGEYVCRWSHKNASGDWEDQTLSADEIESLYDGLPEFIEAQIEAFENFEYEDPKAYEYGVCLKSDYTREEVAFVRRAYAYTSWCAGLKTHDGGSIVGFGNGVVDGNWSKEQIVNLEPDEPCYENVDDSFILTSGTATSATINDKYYCGMLNVKDYVWCARAEEGTPGIAFDEMGTEGVSVANDLDTFDVLPKEDE